MKTKFEDNDLVTQARLISYSQIRELEDQELALAGVKACM